MNVFSLSIDRYHSRTRLFAGKRCAKCARRLGWRKRSRYRSIPGNWAQFKLLFRRAGLKWVRGWGYKFIDLLLFVTAALVIGKPLLSCCQLSRLHPNLIVTPQQPSIVQDLCKASLAIICCGEPAKNHCRQCAHSLALCEGKKYAELFLCAAGAVHGTAWELEKVRGNVTLAMLTLAVISVIASLGVFGKDRLVFCREASSGRCFFLSTGWFSVPYCDVSSGHQTSL